MAAAQWDRLPWNIHFFQRSFPDDPEMTVPALQFFEELPAGVTADFRAILKAVSEGPPISFIGGGKWEAMHGKMKGIFEVRVQGGGKNHRLFCLLRRDDESLGGSSIVCLGGLTKPRREAAKARDYNQIIGYRAEFYRHRKVFE